MRFVGVDGEGVTRADGTHEYVLLSVGEKSLFHGDGKEDGVGGVGGGGDGEGALPLRHEEIFEFLWACHEADPGATFVGYFLGYDFTKWVESFPEDRAKYLFTPKGIAMRQRTSSGGNPTPFPVNVGRWQVDFLGTRRMKLRPRPRTRAEQAAPWMTVCDAGAFFQCSLLKAIDPEARRAPLIPMKDYEVIKRGKERRASAKFDREMIRYNTTENKALSVLMEELNEGLVEVGIRLRKNQWFGPGQAASAWLDQIGAPKSVEFFENTPKWAVDALRATYFGGWFELPVHGPIPGDVEEADINSAYPWVMASLPCPLHGKWSRGSGDETPPSGGLLVRKAVVRGSDPCLGAMLHRARPSAILRPRETSGHFWEHELVAARVAGLVDEIETESWVHYEPCACPPPLRSIEQLYLDRLRVGKDTPGGKSRKLIYNSGYGKFAQSVGRPKYANPMYASLITAGCRVRILQAIASHPDRSRAVVMVATDGVYFRSPHPELDRDNERLGAWGTKTKKNLSVFKPGVYWDDESRTRLAEGKSPKLRSRGVPAKDLGARILEIDAQWERFLERARRGETPSWPELDVDISFRITSPSLALARGKWHTCGKVSTNVPTLQSADPYIKRDVRNLLVSDVVRSRPYGRGDELDSVPYDGLFGEEIRESEAVADVSLELSPDEEFNEALHGA